MTKHNLILIIARASGSKVVSRQNLRLVNGKPLLYYILKTSISCKDCSTFVSTDSEEIEAYTRFYGIETITRPKQLTKDQTTLEDIAIDALKKLMKKGLIFKKCLIIHPHFPLIEKKTINQFFTKLDKNIWAISGFENESDSVKHFAVIKKENKNNILNEISRNVIEIKKIVSFDCQKLLSKKKFGNKIYGIGIPSEEIFSPSNYHDFASLESRMNRKKIIVRVDASKNIGLGHVYNMLTVLNNFRNENILILMSSKKNLGYKKFIEHLYNIKLFSDDNELWKEIDYFKPDIIFNDILNTSPNYVKNLKLRGIFVVNFEDLGMGRKYADLVFNPIFQNKKKIKNEFYGSRYACVREEFRIFKKNSFNTKVRKIGITFGGVDKKNNTCKVLSIIEQSNLLKNVEIEVILGLGYMYKDNLKNLIKKMQESGYNIHFIEKANMLSNHLIDCDFIITSNGRTVFEIAALEIPIISLSVNKREKQHNFVKESDVGYNIDFCKKSSELILKNKIKNMMNDSTRRRFSANLHKEDLLKGIDRVTTKILSAYNKTKSC